MFFSNLTAASIDPPGTCPDLLAAPPRGRSTMQIQ